MTEKKVYTINYWLKNGAGEVVDTSEGGEPLVVRSGAANVIPGLIKAVEGRKEGDKLEVLIPPELAYGSHKPELQSEISVNAFDGVEQVVKGMKFQTNTGGEAQVVQVVAVNGDKATIDANHPLAGLSLNFDIEIISIKDVDA